MNSPSTLIFQLSLGLKPFQVKVSKEKVSDCLCEWFGDFGFFNGCLSVVLMTISLSNTLCCSLLGKKDRHGSME